jgi:hypothetical protein
MTDCRARKESRNEHLRRRQWQRERGDISDAERRSNLDC